MNEWIRYIEKYKNLIRKMSAAAYITFEKLLAIKLIPEGKNENHDYLYHLLMNNDDLRKFVALEANETLLPNQDPKKTWVNVFDYPSLSIISRFMDLSDENQKDIVEFMENVVDLNEIEYNVSLKESIEKYLKRFTHLIKKNDEISDFFEDVINILMNPVKHFFCDLENNYFSDDKNKEKINRKFINFFKSKDIDCTNKDESEYIPNILIYMQQLHDNIYISESFFENYLLYYMKYFISLSGVNYEEEEDSFDEGGGSSDRREESRRDDDKAYLREEPRRGDVYSTIEGFIYEHFNTYFVTQFLKPLEVDKKFWKVLQDPELKIEIRKNDWEIFEEFKKTILLSANFTSIIFNFFNIGSQLFGTNS